MVVAGSANGGTTGKIQLKCMERKSNTGDVGLPPLNFAM